MEQPYALTNPVFAGFLLAAGLMMLKLMLQGWITVYRMIRADAGLLNPEDLLPGPANRDPRQFIRSWRSTSPSRDVRTLHLRKCMQHFWRGSL